MTEKIQKLLAKFKDQRLANLQCAAEDGTLVFQDRCRCLLGHLDGDYSATKWLGETAELAREAEAEFYLLGRLDDGSGAAYFQAGLSDQKRRALMLPLIQAEWARRANERMAEPMEAVCAGLLSV